MTQIKKPEVEPGKKEYKDIENLSKRFAQDKIKKGFDPILEGFDFVPFKDAEALRSKIGPEVCAVMLEPVQGEGGVRCPEPGYLKAVRQICDESGVLQARRHCRARHRQRLAY